MDIIKNDAVINDDDVFQSSVFLLVLNRVEQDLKTVLRLWQSAQAGEKPASGHHTYYDVSQFTFKNLSHSVDFSSGLFFGGFYNKWLYEFHLSFDLTIPERSERFYSHVSLLLQQLQSAKNDVEVQIEFNELSVGG